MRVLIGMGAILLNGVKGAKIPSLRPAR